ncbi:hypothetical protein D6779_01585 [Candidatus Parcubacteria bacterium]|nr:MAG: hypothetical protein D6779_01585 [Candidatus Parcubacteria bacterium]
MRLNLLGQAPRCACRREVCLARNGRVFQFSRLHPLTQGKLLFVFLKKRLGKVEGKQAVQKIKIN